MERSCISVLGVIVPIRVGVLSVARDCLVRVIRLASGWLGSTGTSHTITLILYINYKNMDPQRYGTSVRIQNYG
jgi:hypothetical protein